MAREGKESQHYMGITSRIVDIDFSGLVLRVPLRGIDDGTAHGTGVADEQPLDDAAAMEDVTAAKAGDVLLHLEVLQAVDAAALLLDGLGADLGHRQSVEVLPKQWGVMKLTEGGLTYFSKCA